MDLRHIYQSALELLGPLTTEETYSTIIKEAISLVSGKAGSIFLLEDGQLKRVYASDPQLYQIKIRPSGNTYRVFQSQQPYILTAKKIGSTHPQFKNMQIGSDLCVPLSYGKITRGVISVLSPLGKVFTQEDLRTLEFFAPLAALSIRNSQLFDQTQSALEQRDLFISMTTHELKNPLAAITLYTQLISKKINEKQFPDPKNLNNLSSSINRLTNLINDLSQANQIKMGNFHLDLSSCDLPDLVKQSVIEFRFRIPNHPITFRNQIKTRLPFECDQNRLAQAFSNILNNAAKFSQPGSPIRVRTYLENERINICFTDKGKGISPKDLEHVFDRFYKANNSAPGMGLGLYITKNIVDQHQGSITLKSKIDQGTSITISFPKPNSA